MFTTTDRRETLGRERSRLSKALRRPLAGYVKDKRVIVDALEMLVLLDFKQGDKDHAKKEKK